MAKELENKENENITNDEKLDTENEESLDDFFKNLDLEEPKNKLAENQARKDINYAVALKEKNVKIQEEKAKIAKLEAKLDELNKENEAMLGIDEENVIQKQLKEVQKKLDAAETRSVEKDKLATEQKERALLDSTIEALKEKYKDSRLPFNETKVIAAVLKQNKERATPRDLEKAYESMLLKKMLEDEHKEKGTTEGGSIVGVETPKEEHGSYDEKIEEWLKNKK